MDVKVGAKLLTVTVLLKVDVTPVDVAQILIASPKLYCIAVEVMTPAVTAEPLAGVEVSVPFPAVPPQACVESTGAKLTVAVLFRDLGVSVLILKMNNWIDSKIYVRCRSGRWLGRIGQLLFAPATSVSVPKLVVPFVMPETFDVPDFVMFPVASGVPAVGRT